MFSITQAQYVTFVPLSRGKMSQSESQSSLLSFMGQPSLKRPCVFNSDSEEDYLAESEAQS